MPGPTAISRRVWFAAFMSLRILRRPIQNLDIEARPDTDKNNSTCEAQRNEGKSR